VSEWVPSDSVCVEYSTSLVEVKDEEKMSSTATSKVQFAVPWSSIPVPLLVVTSSVAQRHDLQDCEAYHRTTE